MMPSEPHFTVLHPFSRQSGRSGGFLPVLGGRTGQFCGIDVISVPAKEKNTCLFAFREPERKKTRVYPLHGNRKGKKHVSASSAETATRENTCLSVSRKPRRRQTAVDPHFGNRETSKPRLFSISGTATLVDSGFFPLRDPKIGSIRRIGPLPVPNRFFFRANALRGSKSYLTASYNRTSTALTAPYPVLDHLS